MEAMKVNVVVRLTDVLQNKGVVLGFDHEISAALTAEKVISDVSRTLNDECDHRVVTSLLVHSIADQEAQRKNGCEHDASAQDFLMEMVSGLAAMFDSLSWYLDIPYWVDEQGTLEIGAWRLNPRDEYTAQVGMVLELFEKMAA